MARTRSSRTWESTPDGREGFWNIFLRRGFSTYIVDRPRRGDAGRTTVEGTVTPKPDERMWFNLFRVGVWSIILRRPVFPDKGH